MVPVQRGTGPPGSGLDQVGAGALASFSQGHGFAQVREASVPALLLLLCAGAPALGGGGGVAGRSKIAFCGRMGRGASSTPSGCPSCSGPPAHAFGGIALFPMSSTRCNVHRTLCPVHLRSDLQASAERRAGAGPLLAREVRCKEGGLSSPCATRRLYTDKGRRIFSFGCRGRYGIPKKWVGWGGRLWAEIPPPHPPTGNPLF